MVAPAFAVDATAVALEALRAEPWVAERISHEVILPAVPAQYGAWPPALHPRLREALQAGGRERLYSHQGESVAASLRGEDVVVVTPTASGKSLCYILPTLDAWLRDPEARSLWLFPTKALAQDQLAGLQDVARFLPTGLQLGTYDGDTPPSVRTRMRQAGHVVVTNPDMLHTGVLPHHTRWVRLFQQLRYIVVDELHTYRGVFGSHVANLLRRLRRICQFYGSSPQIIACSATIANPGELAGRLFERPLRCIDRSGAPQAPRRLWFWNPPLHDSALGARRSATLEARRLVGELIRRNLQTIAFARSRPAVEVLLSYLLQSHPHASGEAAAIRGYRSGYLPLERRAIEAGLRDGSVRGVVSTNALELGVDIGHLDAAVLVGYPGSIASTWQQLGRAGRRDTTSLGVLIATDSPLDQFLMRHPEYLLERSPEQGLVDPDNLLVMGGHLQASVFELAFRQGERFGSADVDDLLTCFREDGLVHHSAGRLHWSADAFPAEAISLRSASATNVLIVDTGSDPMGPGQGPQGPWSGSGGGRAGSHGRILGEVDQFAAPVLVHDDAIYLHQGAQYHVERLDWEEKRAYVHAVSVDHYTVAETHSTVRVLECYEGPLGREWTRAHGEVRLSRVAALYKKVRFLTHENVGAGPINVPEQDLHTTACWFRLAAGPHQELDRATAEAALRGMGRALHQAACLLCMGDPRDLGLHTELRGAPSPGQRGGVASPLLAASLGEPQEYVAGWRPRGAESAVDASMGELTIYLYDAVAGGVGFAERCFERSGELAAAARSLVAECRCDRGCPSCTGPDNGAIAVRPATMRLLSLDMG